MTTETVHRPTSSGTDRVPYQLSVAQFHAMIAAGIFRSGDRVELLEGRLVRKMTHNPPHANCITLVQGVLTASMPQGWIYRQQLPITTRESEPEPDFVVVPGPSRRYAQRHPIPDEIALVIEASDATLDEDREDKQRIYARARLPIYWIVNIPERQIEVYTQPRAGRNPAYRQRRDYRPGESIPLVIAGQEVAMIAVDDLLP